MSNWWDRVDWSDPINRDCPLNQGLAGWWMGAPNCYGGTRLQDLLNRNHGTLTSLHTWGGSEAGPVVVGTAATTGISATPESSITDITVFAVTKRPGSIASYPVLFSLAATGGFHNNEIGAYWLSGGQLRCDIWGDNNASGDYSNVKTIDVTPPASGLFSYSIAIGISGAIAYIDGLPAGSASGLTRPRVATGGLQIAYSGSTAITVQSLGISRGSMGAKWNWDMQRQRVAIFPDALRWLRGRSMVSVASGVPATGNRRRRALICGRAA